MPQKATLTPFIPLIPAISHFDLLGLNPDTSEKLSKTFKTLIIYFLIFNFPGET